MCSRAPLRKSDEMMREERGIARLTQKRGPRRFTPAAWHAMGGDRRRTDRRRAAVHLQCAYQPSPQRAAPKREPQPYMASVRPQALPIARADRSQDRAYKYWRPLPTTPGANSSQHCSLSLVSTRRLAFGAGLMPCDGRRWSWRRGCLINESRVPAATSRTPARASAATCL